MYMHGTYNPWLVTLSVIIATLASYTALDLAGRVTAARGRSRQLWLAGGAICMGVGIWSMHFVGMLAFQLPITMSYDPWLVVLSVTVAIAASALALDTVSQYGRLQFKRLVPAGLAMGIAIAGMHYIGMAAMQMNAELYYDRALYITSIVIAITASIAALWLAFRFRSDTTVLGHWLKIGSAIIMGLAIAGMHYTGMAAAQFESLGLVHNVSHSLLQGWVLAGAITIGSLIILGIALTAAFIDRRHHAAERERILLNAHREELEQKVSERTAALREALEAAEIANQTKSDFLARMSHELRTPLNSVIGFSNVLIQNKPGNLTDQQLTYLDRIVVNGKHLLSLINTILDLSKIESGHLQVEAGPVQLDVIINEVLMQMEGVIKGKPVYLRADVAKDLPLFWTDEHKLKQILINLIGNSIKFTEHGAIIVSAKRNNGHFTISVADTGIGIPHDRLKVIFDAFEQVDVSTSRRYGGTGLGLSITKSLCELLGWELSVNSELGEGSTFTIQIPASQIATAAHIQKQPNPAGVLGPDPTYVKHDDGRTVLIIDDDSDSRLLISQYVEEAGYHAVCAASGAEGVYRASEIKPDVITLDLMMPMISGWEVIRKLKTDPELARIPIVIVSIVARDNKDRLTGVVDVIEKPITREDLVNAVHRGIVSGSHDLRSQISSALDKAIPQQ